MRHRLIEKMGMAHTQSKDREEIQRRINKIDQQSDQFMKHAANTCRKIKSGRICFSPESVIWIKREQICKSLVLYKQGHRKNRGNLKRAARKQGIRHPFRLSLAELQVRLDICNERNNYFQQNGRRYQKRHLLRRCEAARQAGKEDVATKILAIIKREQDQDFWRRINHTCGKARGGSITSVQVEGPNNSVNKHVTKSEVEDAIWTNIHCKRFYLAEEAPICHGQLREALGYNAVSPTTSAILNGTYEYPEDFDEATKELCVECALIRQIIPEDSYGQR